MFVFDARLAERKQFFPPLGSTLPAKVPACRPTESRDLKMKFGRVPKKCSNFGTV